MAFINDVILNFIAKTKGTAKVEGDLKRVSKTTAAVTKVIKRATAAFAALFATQKISQFIQESARLASAQQQYEATLLKALKDRVDIQQRLIAQAGRLQEQSIVGDEVIIQQQAFLASLGFTEDQINRLISAALDLSAATGQSLEFGVRNLAKTYAGLTGELGELIPDLKQFTAEELKAGAAVEYATKQFKGQAQALADTPTGRLKALQNQLGDLQEELGLVILEGLQPVVKFLREFIKELDPVRREANKAGKDLKILADAVYELIKPFGQFAEQLNLFDTSNATTPGGKFAEFLAGFIRYATWIPRLLATLITKFKDWAASMNGFTEKWLGLSVLIDKSEKDIPKVTDKLRAWLETIKTGEIYKKNLNNEIENFIKNLGDTKKEIDPLLGSMDAYNKIVAEATLLVDSLPIGDKSFREAIEKLVQTQYNLAIATNRVAIAYKRAYEAIFPDADEIELIPTIKIDENEIDIKPQSVPIKPDLEDSDIDKLEEKLRKLSETASLIASSIRLVSDTILASEIERTDVLIDQQQRRVDEALKIADQGNAEILEREKKQLEKLNKERAKAARNQIIINQALAASEGIVAIVSGFTSGNPVAGIANAVALAATIVSGLAAVRQASAGIGSFFEGEEYVKLQGKHRKGRDTIPAMVHEGERIVPAANNRKYMKDYNILQRGLVEPGVLAELYRSRYKMKDTRSEINDYLGGKIFVNMKGLENRLDAIEKAIKKQPSTSVKISKEGIYAAVSSVKSDLDKINRVK